MLLWCGKVVISISMIWFLKEYWCFWRYFKLSSWESDSYWWGSYFSGTQSLGQTSRFIFMRILPTLFFKKWNFSWTLNVLPFLLFPPPLHALAGHTFVFINVLQAFSTGYLGCKNILFVTVVMPLLWEQIRHCSFL